MAKKIEMVNNWAGGIDLLSERDSGNEILILTGGYSHSIKFWERLKETCESAINILHDLLNKKTLFMKQVQDSLFETFADMGKSMYDLYESPRELAAIWLNMPAMTNEGLTVRIAPGMKIRYDEGYMSATRTDFNYVIITCYGTLINQFRIKVEDLKTGEQSIILL